MKPPKNLQNGAARFSDNIGNFKNRYSPLYFLMGAGCSGIIYSFLFEVFMEERAL